MASLLEVKDLRTEFELREGIVKAVNGISFHLDLGETLGIVGESGCGKSVSMLSVMRLIPQPPGRIVEGEVRFEGRDLLQLDDEEMRRVRGKGIAMVFQDPTTFLNPVLRIGLQISETLQEHLGMDRVAADKRAVELLEQVGIPLASDRARNYPHEFSGGMRQRAMIAIALSCNPQILIADEPTTALDVTIQAQIIDLVKTLRDERGMSVIWITHDLGIIAGLVDRVNVMYAGYIVETGSVEDLYATPRHPYTLGLLRSVPRVDAREKKQLVPIEGVPPDMVNLPAGCPFRPRCTYAIDRCQTQNPLLTPAGLDRRVACWIDVNTGKERT
jgi:oligopeptide transport system ATP-binding protein